MINPELKDRAESLIQRKGQPVRFLEIRRALGLPSSRSQELANALKSDERFYRVGSHWYVRKAPLKIKVRYCPNCSSKKVKLEGGFYSCKNCEIKFHFTWLL